MSTGKIKLFGRNRGNPLQEKLAERFGISRQSVLICCTALLLVMVAVAGVLFAAFQGVLNAIAKNR